MSKLKLYYYTIKDLKPIQIKYQFFDRFMKKSIDRNDSRILNEIDSNDNYKIFINELDEDVEYLQRFDTDGLKRHEVTLINESHTLDLESWNVREASRLWNFNLHYLEFLIPIAVKYQKTKDKSWLQLWKEYVVAWIDHPTIDSIEPYTISIRIPNLLISMECLGGDLKKDKSFIKKINNSIYKQYVYLQNHLEYKLLANHLFENLKAIIIASIYFDEKNVYSKYIKKLQTELNEQILDDGIHYELSIMYHHIILEDLLRIYVMMKSCDYKKDVESLCATIVKMTNAMCSLEKGINRIPLFNDSGNNVAKNSECLKRAVERLLHCTISDNITVFPNAGYAKKYMTNVAIMFDAGALGPRYMSGHAHCDCLSFELFYKGCPVIVNSGTLLYQGKERRYFRSTMAHSTLMIDDREQAELWGEHRASKKSTKFGIDAKASSVEGCFRSYHKDFFKRKIFVRSEAIDIVDQYEVKDEQSHLAKAFYHIGPEYQTYHDENNSCIDIIQKTTNQKLARFLIDDKMVTKIHHDESDICLYSDEFGKKEYIETIEFNKEFICKTEIVTRFIMEEY